MRRVGRLAHRARGFERRRPASRWRRRLALLSLSAAIIVGLGGAIHFARRTGWLEQGRAKAQDAVQRLTVAMGFSIGEVLCEGRERTSSDQLAALLKSYLGQDTFTADARQIRAELEHLPWVRQATVEKFLPSTLFIRLEEHKAIALWHADAGTMLVGADGSLLPVTDIRPFAGLKLLNGEGAPAAAQELIDLLATAPDLASKVTAASRVARRRWNLYLNGRIEVRLPESNAAAAWQRLAELDRNGRLTDRALDSVDMRSSAWMSIRLKGETKDVILGKGA